MTAHAHGAVVVSGATGNVGGEVVAALVARGKAVIGLTRHGDRPRAAGRARMVVGDLNRPDSLRPALDGAKALFLLPGFADMGGLIEQARSHGVQRVVLLSGRSAHGDDRDDAISTYMRASEAAMRQGGVPWTVVRPCALMSNALDWAPSVRRGDVIPVPFAELPTAVVDPVDVAAVAVQALVDGAHAAATIEVTGPEALTAIERAEALAARLGRPVRIRPLSEDEARAHVLATVPQPYADAFLSFYLEGTLDESEVLPTVRELLGRPPRTFAQWVAAHVDAFA